MEATERDVIAESFDTYRNTDILGIFFSTLDLFKMNLFTKLLELASVIHESSSLPPLLFCGLTFTRLIESVLYKIWTQAHGFLFLNLFHAAYTFPQPAFIPFFSALHHNFPSNSQLTSTYCIICLKAKCYRMEGTKFILLSAFHVSSH